MIVPPAATVSVGPDPGAIVVPAASLSVTGNTSAPAPFNVNDPCEAPLQSEPVAPEVGGEMWIEGVAGQAAVPTCASSWMFRVTLRCVIPSVGELRPLAVTVNVPAPAARDGASVTHERFEH